jgi:phosphatidylinositol dimannoside acyltransferase
VPDYRLYSAGNRLLIATLKRRLRREATLLAWHTWQRLDSVLPRPIRFLIATALGELLFLILPGKRSATLANVRQVLGPDARPEEVLLVAKRSFRNYAKYLSEFTHLPRWSEEDMERLIDSVSGWEHIEEALADGKGVIFVTPHFGNWDVAGWYFGKRHAFYALVQGWRRAKHITIIPVANAARGVMRALHAGGLVALVADRPTHAQGDGARVRFFGEWTRVPAGAAHFALKTGAPVVATGVWRTPTNTYAAFALPPLRFDKTSDPHLDVDSAMQRIMERLEIVIRAHPDQWYMFRRMWPAQPEALPQVSSPFGPVSQVPVTAGE